MPGPKVWTWVKRPVEWKITPLGISYGGLDQPLLPRSTTEVISKTFPLSNTQGTMGDQFPSGLRCHLPLSSPRKTPWRVKNHWCNHLRINETFSPNFFHIKCWLIGLKKEITPRVLFHDERMAEPRGDGTNIPPNPVGNRTAGERGKGKFSLK